MKLIEFDVFDAQSTGKVSLDIQRVEVVVDLEKLGHVGATQITMQSGTKFFVKANYNEVVKRILTGE